MLHVVWVFLKEALYVLLIVIDDAMNVDSWRVHEVLDSFFWPIFPSWRIVT